jgi:hypothetical protein
MFMNMITDNYAQSTDFDKYVNKIIDDNDKIQSQEFYRICETRDCD